MRIGTAASVVGGEGIQRARSLGDAHVNLSARITPYNEMCVEQIDEVEKVKVTLSPSVWMSGSGPGRRSSAFRAAMPRTICKVAAIAPMPEKWASLWRR